MASRDILRLTAKVLEEASISIMDVGLIAVTVGPGSFTGVRAAMAAAMGLAQAYGAQVAGARTLEAVAGCAPSGEGRVTAASPARKGRVYASMFQMAAAGPVELTAPGEIPAADLAIISEYPLRLIGEGFEAQIDQLLQKSGGGAKILAPVMTVAASAALMAHHRALRGENFRLPPAPEYVGRPQAEVLRGGSPNVQPLSGGENDGQSH